MKPSSRAFLALAAILVIAGVSWLTETQASPPISQWVTVNMGEPLNSPYHEAFSTVTEDERTIYFGSNRPGGYSPADPDIPWPFASYDIWVAHRKSRRAPWGAPRILGPNINTIHSEHSVSVSPDGRTMFFASDRPGGCGGLDLYMSQRSDPRDDGGWGPPVNLGCTINSPYVDSCPIFRVDPDGTIKLYFVQANLDAPPDSFLDELKSLDLMVSDYDPASNTFAAPRVFGLSTEYQDSHFDPINGFIWANYPTGFGGGDIWISLERDGQWTNPINLGPDVNTQYEEQIPTSSPDGRRLYFASDRPGGLGGVDLYLSTLRSRPGR